jgi:CarboxypepD_reg-like domain
MKNYFTKTLLLFLLMYGGAAPVFGQNFTISGTLKDASNGEDLIGASVIVVNKAATGATTNTYGFFSITLPKGAYQIRFQYLGYVTVEETITLDKDFKFNKELAPESTLIAEVEIKAQKENKNVSRNEMSVTKLDPKDIEAVPVLFGEKRHYQNPSTHPGRKIGG